jgi:hypothetical protein
MSDAQWREWSCQLDFGREESRFFVSITYLRFAGSATLSREITAYQRHRFKRLRRQLAG